MTCVISGNLPQESEAHAEISNVFCMTSWRRKICHFGAHPVTGDVLSVLAGVMFLSVAMLMPLVGRAGSATPWADRNARTFEAAALTAQGIAWAAVSSKFFRRRCTGAPAPRATLVLVVVLLLIWVAFRAGELAR